MRVCGDHDDLLRAQAVVVLQSGTDPFHDSLRAVTVVPKADIRHEIDDLVLPIVDRDGPRVERLVNTRGELIAAEGETGHFDGPRRRDIRFGNADEIRQ